MDLKLKERFKLDNLKREAVNSFWVTTGIVGATFLDRLVQKGVDLIWKDSTVPDWVKYAKPFGPVLTGFAISVLAKPGEEGNPMRLVGYGVTGAGAISALRLIPQFDKLMSEPAAATTTPPPQTSGIKGLLGLTLGDFGNSENIKRIDTADAEPTSIDLPDLGDVDRDERDDYSSAQMGNSNEFEEVIAEVI